MIALILNGHTSPETALVVEDNSSEYQICRKIRYWLQLSTKGMYRGRSRFFSQTLDPKFTNEIWGTRKISNYGKGVTLMYLDEEGHVHYVDLTLNINLEWLEAALVAPGLTNLQKGMIEETIKTKHEIKIRRDG